jgi:hypothetical protein
MEAHDADVTCQSDRGKRQGGWGQYEQKVVCVKQGDLVVGENDEESEPP